MNKINIAILVFLLIAVSVTLYQTDQKYSNLKEENERKQNIINNQISFIKQKNLKHEIDIEKKFDNLIFQRSKNLDKNIKLFNQDNIKLKYFKNSNQLVRGINNIFPGSAYIDYYDDKIFLVSSTGILGYSIIQNDENINFKQIKNNIANFISFDQFKKNNWFSIKDILVYNGKVLISYTKELSKDCWNTSLIYSDINFDYMEFKELFAPKECVNSIKNEDNEFNAHQSGGRIVKNNNEHVFFSLGDFRARSLAQSDKSVFGKIIKINIKNGNYKIISKGHRNPQGLKFNADKNYLISTEHGPRGGDEINLHLDLKNIKNFGWPISSYGEHYSIKDNPDKYLKYPLNKSHKKFGFEEPIKYFVPSIGISEIINFKDNRYIVSSLNYRSIYTFTIDKKYKLKDLKRIVIGERIRDIIHQKNEKKIYVFLEDLAGVGLIEYN
tara:strand:- start:1772 stop:3091 length:1320 start_codon:yes stop_codon:yes gene_type:complete